MANYGLKMEVERLESRLNRIIRDNERLNSEIAAIIRSVNEADVRLTEYNRQVGGLLDNARGAIDGSADRALGSFELQGQIDRLYTGFKGMELANKKIRALNNKKYYEFNSYRTVRKIVKGLMDNLDLNLVSDEVIYKSIERQHLQTPEFWLTPVLISIMAWKNDDRALADRAVETACRLDRKNGSIFYMIFNLRMGREQAAVKWFLEYQKSALQGSDENTVLLLFSLISRTLRGNVDEETAGLIRDWFHRLMAECVKGEGYSEEEAVGEIKGHMTGTMDGRVFCDLPMLAKYCGGYGAIMSMLRLAGNNYNILEFILRVVKVPPAERNTYLKEYLSDLLEQPCDVEREAYDELEYNELVIRLRGDEEQAREIFKRELLRRRSDFNILSSAIRWIYDFGNDDINGQMRLHMFTLVKEFQEKAARSCFADYRAMYREVQPVQILDYAADVDFSQEDAEMGKVEAFYQERQERELAPVRDIWAYVSLGVGAACAVAAIFVHLLFLVGLCAGAAAGGAVFLSNRRRRRSVVWRMRRQRESVQEILRGAFADFEKMRALYKEYDGISERILEEYAKL